ncbi:MAG: DUF4266 domain-containing protein [Bacteroidota bacterium]
MKNKYLFLALLLLFTLNACQTVKPYERIYLNDPAMQMGISSPQGFENYVQTIREGAIPAGTTKASGGCGCN